jgi:hypothetical protein
LVYLSRGLREIVLPLASVQVARDRMDGQVSGLPGSPSPKGSLEVGNSLQISVLSNGVHISVSWIKMPAAVRTVRMPPLQRALFPQLRGTLSRGLVAAHQRKGSRDE